MFKRLARQLKRRWLSGVRLSSKAVDVPEYEMADRRAMLMTLASNPAFELLVSELHNRRIHHQKPPVYRQPKSLDDILAYNVAMARHEEAQFWTHWLETQVLNAIYSDRLYRETPADNQVPAPTVER